MLWAKILTLLVRPWSGSNRMKSLVEQGTDFGYAGRVLVEFFGPTEKSSKQLHGQGKAQEDSTLELALILFENEFTKEKLQDYISDLKRLKYAKETQEEARQKYLEAIFEKMLTLKSKQSSPKNFAPWYNVFFYLDLIFLGNEMIYLYCGSSSLSFTGT